MLEEKIDEMIREVTQKAKTTKRLALFSIANTANINNAPLLFPAIRETKEVVCGNVLVTSLEQVKKIIPRVDGVVDIVLVDAETKLPGLEDVETWVRQNLKKSKLFTFKPNDLTVAALDSLLAHVASPLRGKKIAIIGTGNIGSKVALKLVERGVNVVVTRRDEKILKRITEGLNAIKPKYEKAKVTYVLDPLKASLDADILLGVTPGVAAITNEMIQGMKPSGLVVDVGNGTIFPEAVALAQQLGIKVLCLFMKPGFDGALQTIFQTENSVQKIKKQQVDSFAMISGGFMGQEGDIIVDDVKNPTRVLAIADGRGDVLADIKDPRFQKNITKVEQLIKESRVS